MKVIIIEDEKPAARRLKRMLGDMNIETQVMLHSVKESITYLSNHDHPNLIMLDIQLSDGLSFEIFEAIKIKSSIIFTTAYDEYTLKAFKLNSVDYLLKPIDVDELNFAIRKFKNNHSIPSNIQIDLEQIKKLLINPLNKNYKLRFTIKIGQHIRMVNTDQIECFYSENKASYLYTNENKNYLVDYALEQLEDQLDPNKFFRVNRKFYININAIKDIIAYTNSRLQIKLNSFKELDIIVSREKVKDFKNWLT